MRLLFAIFLLCSAVSLCGQSVVSGYVTDSKTGESLLFATVVQEGSGIGVNTNEYGYYAITVVPDLSNEIKLSYSFIGYETSIRGVVTTDQDVTLDVSLAPSSIDIGEAVIEADRTVLQDQLRSSTMSTTRLPMKTITRIPTLGGESDILKVVQLLPGVQGGTEGGTDMFVRGGDADQNLVLLDEATVYNTGHLFGFFSVFNSDALSDVTLIKGAFPGKYGGRLSSILDIRQKEGNLNEFHGKGGIGLLSSRLTLEGPIKKDKASFLISGRRTYIDQVFRLANQFLPYYFYDVNAKVNWKMGANDRLFVSNYIGDDVLNFDQSDFPDDDSERDNNNDDAFNFGFNLGNVTNSVRWNHIYNSKLFSNITALHTQFDYDIRGQVGNNNILIASKVRDYGLKADYDYYASNTRKVQFGTQVLHHRFRPNVISTAGEVSRFLEGRTGGLLTATEYGVYASDERDFQDGVWKVMGGLRLTGAFAKGKPYFGFEPRAAVRRMLSENDALKLSYSQMTQYMHRVSSSSVSLPTDLWYPVTKEVAPQRSHQVAVGYQRILPKMKTKVEVEAYYKSLKNVIEYREGANLIFNDNFEEELIQGNGDAYGVEALVKRDEGKLSGWVSYTLSWSTRDFEELNGGRRYFAKYDRRHSASLVLSWEMTKRWTLSGVWVYATGSRFTPQVGQYVIPNPTLTGYDVVPIYSERNAVKLSPSHRLDINFVLGPRPDKKSRFKSEWHFGAYNVYNRAAPFRTDIRLNETAQGIEYQYVQPGLFGFIPSIAYNFEF